MWTPNHQCSHALAQTLQVHVYTLLTTIPNIHRGQRSTWLSRRWLAWGLNCPFTWGCLLCPEKGWAPKRRSCVSWKQTPPAPSPQPHTDAKQRWSDRKASCANVRFYGHKADGKNARQESLEKHQKSNHPLKRTWNKTQQWPHKEAENRHPPPTDARVRDQHQGDDHKGRTRSGLRDTPPGHPVNPASAGGHAPWQLLFSRSVLSNFFETPRTVACQAPLSRILQARILEWVAMPFSRGSSQPRSWTCISCVKCIESGFFIHWATGEAHI